VNSRGSAAAILASHVLPQPPRGGLGAAVAAKHQREEQRRLPWFHAHRLGEALLDAEPHRPPQERSVVLEHRRRLRRVLEQPVGEHPINLEVGRSAEQVVVHPGGVRPLEIDTRRRPLWQLHRHDVT
jgi:hypothetical protein